jgi:acyl dehydratase
MTIIGNQARGARWPRAKHKKRDRMGERYLEDFAVGQIFVSGRLRVTKEQIKAFAAEFDPQPFHLDEEAAQNTFFKGLAASGWHTAVSLCGFWSRGSLSRPAVSLAQDSTNSVGQNLFGQGMSCALRAKYWRSDRHDRGQTKD